MRRIPVSLLLSDWGGHPPPPPPTCFRGIVWSGGPGAPLIRIPGTLLPEGGQAGRRRAATSTAAQLGHCRPRSPSTCGQAAGGDGPVTSLEPGLPPRSKGARGKRRPGLSGSLQSATATPPSSWRPTPACQGGSREPPQWENSEAPGLTGKGKATRAPDQPQVHGESRQLSRGNGKGLLGEPP